MQHFLEKLSLLSDKQLKLLALQQKKKLDKVERSMNEPIAIVGYSSRWPGAADSDQFWENIVAGKSSIIASDKERWNMAAHYSADKKEGGKLYTKRLGLMDSLLDFDAEFFGISPKEAERMDPQQRLLLETSWHALEKANIPPSSLVGSKTGVFVGLCNQDYTNLRVGMANNHGYDKISSYDGIGSAFSTAVGRLSYSFGFQGPCLSIDTACSSSLNAIHVAANSLRTEESTVALAAGANVILDPITSVIFSQAGMLSEDGRCFTFDERANGYVRAEGCGVLVLKRLQDAQRDGDTIFATLVGSAINQDGFSQGLTAPNEKSQIALIKDALASSNLTADDIDYIEAHGTGTPLGDPIEFGALAAVFGKRPDRAALKVGSVKTNIGHAEAAAGIASVIKVLKSMHHKVIAPHINFTTPSSKIDWDSADIEVPLTALEWPSIEGKPRYAGISSFGFGGSNAHLILSDEHNNDAADAQLNQVDANVIRPLLLPISAKNVNAIAAQKINFCDFLSRSNGTNVAPICYAAAVGRDHLKVRQAYLVDVHGNSKESLINALKTEHQATEIVQNLDQNVAYLFTGQGSQYAGMGETLYQSEAIFRDAIDQCATLLNDELGFSLQDLLWGEQQSKLSDTRYTQPSLFCIEYALFQLWKSWGVQPASLLGHSVGEYAAACCAGVFSLQDGLKLLNARARLMSSHCSTGAMCVVFANPKQLRPILDEYSSELCIASYNGPTNLTLSGSHTAISACKQWCAEHKFEVRDLDVSHAFHSPLMEPMLQEFSKVAETIEYHTPLIPFVSTVTGTMVTNELCDPGYWVKHVHEAVHFSQAMEVLLDKEKIDLFIEIGPQASLSSMAKRLPVSDKRSRYWVASMSAKEPQIATAYYALADVYQLGLSIDWTGFYQDYALLDSTSGVVGLPSYPFQGKRYWLDGDVSSDQLCIPVERNSTTILNADSPHSLLGRKVSLALPEAVYFENLLSLQTPSYMAQHLLYKIPVVAGASHIVQTLQAAHELLETSAISLNNIEFIKPLVLSTDAQNSKRVQMVMKPSGLAETAKSYQANLLGFDSQSSEWQTHFTAVVTDNKQARPKLMKPLLPSQLNEQWHADVSSSDFYQNFWDKGYTVGDKFHWFGDGYVTDQAAVRVLEIESRSEMAEDFLIYPGLLDACFQVIDGARKFLHEGQLDESLFIPSGIRVLDFYGIPAQQTKLYCHAKLSNESTDDSVIGDIQLYTESGDLILSIEGFEARKVARDTLQRLVLAQTPTDHVNCLQVGWHENKHISELIEQPSSLSDTVDIFIGATNEQQKVVAKLSGGNAYCVTYAERFDFDVAQRHITINDDEPQSWTRLLNELQQHINGHYRLLFLSDGVDHFDVELTSPWSGYSGLIALGQAIARSGNETSLSELVVVTQAAFSITEADVVQPSERMLAGFLTTLSMELSQSVRLIDVEKYAEQLDLASLWPLFSLTDQLGDVRQVSVRNGQYFTPVLQPVTAGKTQQPTDVANQDGTFVITGGLGGIGLAVAKYLVLIGVKEIALISRNSPSQAANEAISMMREQGALVTCFAQDVSDYDGLDALLSGLRQTSNIVGVIHAAGVLGDGLLTDLTVDDFSNVLAAKANGASNLHLATQQDQLSCFVLFSSITAQVGSIGQSNYAMANAYLDGLADYRRSLGMPSISLAWGAWDEIGMATRLVDVQRDRISKQGLAFMSVDQCLTAFGRALQATSVNWLVADIDWPVFLNNRRDLQGKHYLNNLFSGFLEGSDGAANEDKKSHLMDELLRLPSERRASKLSRYIQVYLTKALRHDSSFRMKLSDKFFDLGVDSLAAVDMKIDIEQQLAVPLSPTLLFDYPTLGQLVNYLESLVEDKLGEPDVKSTQDSVAEELDKKVVPMTNALSDIEALLNSSILDEAKKVLHVD
jgi:acyl transferase domain-containing protein/acyl carrier protein